MRRGLPRRPRREPVRVRRGAGLRQLRGRHRRRGPCVAPVTRSPLRVEPHGARGPLDHATASVSRLGGARGVALGRLRVVGLRRRPRRRVPAGPEVPHVLLPRAASADRAPTVRGPPPHARGPAAKWRRARGRVVGPRLGGIRLGDRGLPRAPRRGLAVVRAHMEHEWARVGARPRLVGGNLARLRRLPAFRRVFFCAFLGLGRSTLDLSPASATSSHRSPRRQPAGGLLGVARAGDWHLRAPRRPHARGSPRAARNFKRVHPTRASPQHTPKDGRRPERCRSSCGHSAHPGAGGPRLPGRVRGVGTRGPRVPQVLRACPRRTADSGSGNALGLARVLLRPPRRAPTAALRDHLLPARMPGDAGSGRPRRLPGPGGAPPACAGVQWHLRVRSALRCRQLRPWLRRRGCGKSELLVKLPSRNR